MLWKSPTCLPLLTLVPSMFILAHPHLLPYLKQEFNITLLYYYRIWVMYRTKVQQLTQITQTRHQKDGKKLGVIILIRKMMHRHLCMCKSTFPCTNMLHIIQIFWILYYTNLNIPAGLDIRLCPVAKLCKEGASDLCV